MLIVGSSLSSAAVVVAAAASYFNASAAPPPVVFNPVARVVDIAISDSMVARHRYQPTTRIAAAAAASSGLDGDLLVDDVVDGRTDGGRRATGRRRRHLHGANASNIFRIQSVLSGGYVLADQVIRIKNNRSSPHGLIQVMLLCQLAAATQGRCSPLNSSWPADATHNATPSWPTSGSASSNKSTVVILRFVEINKILCIEQNNKIVLRDQVDRLEDCALQRQLAGAYDIYFSWKYPRSCDSCDQSKRWYVCVDNATRGNKKLRTCVNAVNKNRRKTYFLQREANRSTDPKISKYYHEKATPATIDVWTSSSPPTSTTHPTTPMLPTTTKKTRRRCDDHSTSRHCRRQNGRKRAKEKDQQRRPVTERPGQTSTGTERQQRRKEGRRSNGRHRAQTSRPIET